MDDFFSSRSGPLKAASLQQCMGTAEGSPMRPEVGLRVMESLYNSIVACAHLENGTGCRTVTMAAPLLLTSGPVSYEAMLRSCGTSSVGERGW